jgi:hypothetical protein
LSWGFEAIRGEAWESNGGARAKDDEKEVTRMSII